MSLRSVKSLKYKNCNPMPEILTIFGVNCMNLVGGKIQFAYEIRPVFFRLGVFFEFIFGGFNKETRMDFEQALRANLEGFVPELAFFR